MFQRWSRSNNPQAKVLTTVPRATWHQRVVSPTVSPGNQVASWSTQTLPLHAGLCRGGPYTSLANHGNNMEKNDLNKRMCEELFGGKMEVTVMPHCYEKSDARRQKNCLYWILQNAMKSISTIEEMVQKVDEFCRMKRNTFLPIREGIAEVLHKLKQLRKDTEHTEGWAESFGNQLGKALGREVKLARAQSIKSVRDEGCQTAPQIVVSSTPELRKWPRELTVNPQYTAAKKPEMKRPKAFPR